MLYQTTELVKFENWPMFVLIIAVWKMLLAINLPFGDSFYMPLPKQSWIMLILEMASRSSRCNGTPDLDGTKLGKKNHGFPDVSSEDVRRKPWHFQFFQGLVGDGLTVQVHHWRGSCPWRPTWVILDRPAKHLPGIKTTSWSRINLGDLIWIGDLTINTCQTEYQQMPIKTINGNMTWWDGDRWYDEIQWGNYITFCKGYRCWPYSDGH